MSIRLIGCTEEYEGQVRGGLMILKFVTKGRQALPPPKNSYKDMNPPLNMHQQLRSPHKFKGQSMDLSLPPVRILKIV